MTDDKPHEYVPHEWRDIAVGTRDECRERIAEITKERDELRAALALATMQITQLRAKMEDDGR